MNTTPRNSLAEKLRYIACALLVVGLAAPAFTEDSVQTLEVSPGERLIVDLSGGGAIEVEGWADNRIEATADVGRGGSLRLERTANGIRLRSALLGRNRPRGGVRVRVPHDFDLDLETMGGSVKVRNVNGTIEGKTMGGPLEFTELGGRLDFTTMGGDVRLTDSDVDGKVKTMGGKVLLENVVGNVDGSSMGGAVQYKNVTRRDGESTGDRVMIHTMGGNIDVDEAPFGAEVETMGGAIWVGSATDFVKAKTMGGSITIESLDGGGQLTSMGGDIRVVMVGNPATGKRDLEVRSMSGEVTVTVPDGLEMEIDIELAYTKKHDGKYNIQSDFPLETKRSTDWDYDGKWGDPRKLIIGTATVGSGQHRLKIRTVNGNIILRRGH